MTYNKLFHTTLSTAVVASLLIGCQGSDKQKTQILRSPRGGTSTDQNKTGGQMSPTAATSKPQDATIENVGQVFEKVAQPSQSLVEVQNLEEGDYVLSRIVFDVQSAGGQNGGQKTRVTAVASVDGDTVCANVAAAAPAPAAPAPTAGKPRPNPAPAVTANSCDNSKIQVDSINAGISAGLVNLPGSAVTSANSYLRFKVASKKIVIDQKDVFNVKAGQIPGKGLGIDISKGSSGNLTVFTFITEGNNNYSTNSVYKLKDDSTSNAMAVSIRKLGDGTLSITFENNRTSIAPSRFDQFVFQYRKAVKSSSATPAPTDDKAGQSATPPPSDKSGDGDKVETKDGDGKDIQVTGTAT